MEISRQKKILFALVTPLGLALLLELGVRLVCWAIGRVPYTAATPWCVADDDLLYVFKPGFEGKVYQATARINNFGFRGEDITLEKPAGTARVLCLGDSRTFGFVTAQTECYPSRLEQLWPQRHPGRRLEVLNSGTHGHSSFQGLRYLELRGLKFQPDVVTVALGANDRRFVLAPEQADGADWFRQAARSLRWRSRMRFSYALLGTMKLLSRFRGENTWSRDVLALPSQRLENLTCRVSLDAYRENLRFIARLCRERKIGLVFLIMNDSPPVEEGLEEGRQLRAAKKYEEAIAAFSKIGRIPSEPATEQWCKPLVLYEIGLTREAQGRPNEAQEAFRESAQTAAFWSVMGGKLVRFAKDYSDAMREVAEEYHVPMVNVAAQFAERPDLFSDYCHFTAEGHRLIAESLAECLEKNGALR